MVKGKTKLISSASFSELSSRLIRSTSKAFSRIAFLKHISPILCEISGLPDFEIWVQDNNLYYRWYYCSGEDPRIVYNRLTSISDSLFCNLDNCKEPTPLERLYHQVFSGIIVFSRGFARQEEYFYAPDIRRFFEDNDTSWEHIRDDSGGLLSETAVSGSLLLIKFRIDSPNTGLIAFRDWEPNAFPTELISHLQNTAELLGVALADRRSQFALKERVKELTCLYEIAQIGANPKLTIDQLLTQTANLLPSAWQYPELAVVKIEFGGNIYTSGTYEHSETSISRDLAVSGQVPGSIEIGYRDFISELGEEAFLQEEYSFISSVASQLSTLLERRLVQLEKAKLQEQLRHADRLATIGQLAAGVAHELNEPLAAILGFAQLIQSQDAVLEQINLDAGRIVNASLHAREVIKKLLIFARRLPQKNSFIRLNAIIENDLYFLESRCHKEDITLIRNLGDIPEIWADESQVHQIIINVTVNAIQAMPGGGTLTITTGIEGGDIRLSVKDTGMGMDAEVRKKLFLPFFTTKKVGEGTGIGLSVVHGIIQGMKGRIDIESEPGKGSAFNIYLPLVRGEKQE